MYTGQRTLRLADGPDEVHHMVVGRAEIARYQHLVAEAAADARADHTDVGRN
jgi:acyl-CoA dehydrogenase